METRRIKKLLTSFIFNKHVTLKKLINLGLIFIQHQFIKNSKVKGYPVRLVIEPTNICNLSCPLCPAGLDNKAHERGMMKLEEFKKIIDEVGDYLYEIDLYNFGESLLNPEVYDMIKYASDHNIKTNLSTNLNVVNVEKLVNSGLSKLIVSADGASHQTYKQYRVYGNYNRVMKNMEAVIAKKEELRKKYPKIVWQFIVMKHNEHEIPKVKQIATELGIKVDIKPMRLNTAIDIEVQQNNTEVKAKWLPTIDNLRRIAYKAKKPKRVGPKSCLFLWNQAVINWNGTVTPCCAIFDYNTHKFGHIAEDGGLLKAWNSEVYQKARKMVRHMDPNMEQDKKYDMCSGCIKYGFVDV